MNNYYYIIAGLPELSMDAVSGAVLRGRSFSHLITGKGVCSGKPECGLLQRSPVREKRISEKLVRFRSECQECKGQVSEQRSRKGKIPGHHKPVGRRRQRRIRGGCKTGIHTLGRRHHCPRTRHRRPLLGKGRRTDIVPLFRPYGNPRVHRQTENHRQMDEAGRKYGTRNVPQACG